MTTRGPSEREIALLPCPFCGGVAAFEEIKRSPEVSNWTVGCDERNDDDEILCYGYQSLTTFATKKEAAAAWNKRDARALAAARAEGMEWRPISECAFGQQIVGTASTPEGWHDPVVGWWTEEGDDWPTHWTPTHFLLVPEPPQEPGE